VFDVDARRELGRSVLDLGKGHAEHLMAVIEAALAQAGIKYGQLDRVGVSVGPGSFTGVRVGVSTARGLALALKIPAIGVSTLEAVAANTRAQFAGANVLVAFNSIDDTMQAALYDPSGQELLVPSVISMKAAIELAMRHEPTLAGNAARKIAEAAGNTLAIGSESNTADISIYAGLAATKGDGAEKPKPLYLRDPDAKPQAGFVLPRV
jgi:tRNA threonylcarbamoyl adenosine modification protein YeaZ